VHVHVEVDDEGHTALPQSFLDWSAKYFKSGGPRTPTIDEIAQRYRERRIAAVIFTVDCREVAGAATDQQRARRAGRRPAHATSSSPSRASIRRARCRWRQAELERLIADHGVKGVKFHPSLQNFAPNDGTAYGLFEVLAATSCRPCSTPGRPASALGCRVVAG
jgi:predicted TIM-barrel fold metal-dependent hydrolase